jgi:glycosyltransferase involved in cell wall biosynthesis
MPVSIVMPTYNGMQYLEQAVDSVLSQSCHDWELVISDDGSTDGTREFLSSLKDARVRVYFQPRNLGIFGNLNFLFSQVSHESTQILCQDHYFVDNAALDRLRSQWSTLPEEIAFLRSNHSLDANSVLSRYEASALPPIVDPGNSDLFFFIFGCIPGNLSNVSVRTKMVKEAGWFRTDLPYAGDFEFWSRLGRWRPWAIASVRVTHVRGHQEQASVTLNRKGELLAQAREVIESLYDRLVMQDHSRSLLRLMATVNYTSQHRDRGVKEAIRGQGSGYLGIVAREMDAARFSFGPALGWLIYVGSLGGRMYRVPLAKQLLKRVVERLQTQCEAEALRLGS